MTNETVPPWMLSVAVGLILAKSLSAPRWSEIPGAYSDKISFYAPLVRKPVGIIGLILYPIPAPAKVGGYN